MINILRLLFEIFLYVLRTLAYLWAVELWALLKRFWAALRALCDRYHRGDTGDEGHEAQRVLVGAEQAVAGPLEVEPAHRRAPSNASSTAPGT